VIKSAREALKNLEEKGIAAPKAPKDEDDGNLTIENYLEKSVCDKLRRAEIDVMTPIEALTLLYELKKTLG
jgi:DNA mismatch repair protein MutS